MHVDFLGFMETLNLPFQPGTTDSYPRQIFLEHLLYT
jgi:hypothetical protein